MPLTNIKIRSTKKTTVAYDFPSPASLPAGIYTSCIVSVESSQTQGGDAAVDLLHDLKDAKGRVYHVRSRYKLDSTRFAELGDALIAAGLSEDDSIQAAVGVEEKITIKHDGGFAQIADRNPL